MVESRTARLGLPQWSSGASDSPSRDDFNEAFANLELLAARFESGTLAERRAPGLANTYYVDESGSIYRDTGTAWTAIGTPRNALNIVKESGTAPAIRAEVPAGFDGVDAITTVHAGQPRFRVQSDGSVTASSVRIPASATAPPPASAPTTLGVNARTGAHAGLTIWGAVGQNANLLETRTSGGAELTTLNPAGDLFTYGRGSVGSMTPFDSQFFVKASQEYRPAVLIRGSKNTAGSGPILLAQSADGSLQLIRLDASGKLAVGDRGNTTQYDGDLLALNVNQPSTNNGATARVMGRYVIRNTAAGHGIASLVARQERGDGPGTASLGIHAGTAPADGEAPERVRFGITPDKHGARFTSQDNQWTPMVVRGHPTQSAPLLTLQNGNSDMVAQVAADGALTARKLTLTSAEPSTLGGDLTVNGVVQGTQLRAVQGGGPAAGVVSQIKAATDAGAHFTAQDENGRTKARINRDGTLEIGMDTNAVAADAVLLTMRGVQYRQNGRKLQTYNPEVNKWGSIESAFAVEFYASRSVDVDNSWTPIPWGGKENDTESAFPFIPGSTVVVAPFTGWYDVRALSHANMNFTGSGAGSFRINGVVQMKFRRDFPRAFGFDVVTISVNDLVFLNAGDRLEFVVRIDSFLFDVDTLNSGNYRSRMSLKFSGNP